MVIGLMIVLIVAIIAPIVLVIKGDLWDFGAGVWLVMMILFCGFLLSSMIAFVGGCFISCGNVPLETECIESVDIVSLKDNFNTEGVFCIGSGSIEEDLVYYYAYESDKGITIGEIPANETYINYSNDKPRLETYNTHFESEFLKHNFVYLGEDAEYYKLYIPEGSVIEEYKIDLEE